MSIPLRITHRTTSHESPYMVKDITGTVVFYAKYEHEAIAFVRGVQFASNQKGRKMAHIESMETQDTGGHCLVDILNLPNGKILAISDEYAGLYESLDGMYENEPVTGFWLNQKGE